MFDVMSLLTNNLNTLRQHIKNQKKGAEQRKRRRQTVEDYERTATAQTKLRQEDGFSGDSDREESLPPEERKKELTEFIEQQGYPHDDAEELAAHTVDFGLKYVWAEQFFDSTAFFSVTPKAGTLTITLNRTHPALSLIHI